MSRGSSVSAPQRRRPGTRWSDVLAVTVILAVLAVVVAVVRHTDEPQPPRPSSSPPRTFSTNEGPPVPQTGAYLGAWVGTPDLTQPGRVQAVHQFEAEIGTPLRIVHTYRTWLQPVGTESDLALMREGRYLLLSWATPDLRTITSGSEDSVIEAQARRIAQLPGPVFLELRWEMDRPNLANLVHGPSEYVAAWTHVRAVFHAADVTNVAWVWCPTGSGFDNGTAPAYYPGDNQVDWICADVYPKEQWKPNNYQSFAALSKAFLLWAEKRPKPIMIGETASSVAYGSRRAGWIADAASFVKKHSQIKAFLWFEQGGEPAQPAYYNFLLVGDPPSLKAFAAMAGDPYFRPAD